MTIRVLQGDCRVVMASLEAASIQAVVMSPPYYGLRAYGTPPLIWDGDPACAHDFAIEVVEQEMRKGAGLAVLGEQYRGGGHKQGTEQLMKLRAERGFCRRCGAWQGHFGLEPTWQMYVEHMLEIFDGIWRVLRDDGTVWLNLGDCYATGAGGGAVMGGSAAGTIEGGRVVDWGFRDRARGGRRRPAMGKHADLEGQIEEVPPNRLPQPRMRAKSKMLLPHRVAIALSDAGWIVRQDNIWHKLNPMPESTYDRTTTAHEYVFHLAKSTRTLLWRHRDGRWSYTKPVADYVWRNRETREESREPRHGWIRVNLWRGHDYYYDAAAIMEPSSPDSHARAARGRSDDHKWADGGPGDQTIAVLPPVAGSVYRPAVAGWDSSVGERRHGTVNIQTVGVGAGERPRKGAPNGAASRAGTNSRENIDRVPEPRKAGVNPKAAAEEQNRNGGPKSRQNADYSQHLGATNDLVAFRNKRSVWPLATEAFRDAHFATFPTDLVRPCVRAGAPVGGWVLDPFGGSGTTAEVCDQEQRHCISIELNPEYVQMQENRLTPEHPTLFHDVTIERAAE